MIKNSIIQHLDAARIDVERFNAQISDLERRRDIAIAKAEAFELSAKYVEDMQPTQESRTKTRRSRMPSSDWITIFGELYSRYSTGFGYNQILGAASTIGISLKRGSLRTKMANLADKGYVIRTGDGEFKITVEGIQYFGLNTTGQKETENSRLPPAPVTMNKTPSTQILGVSKVTDEVEASSNDDDDIRYQHRRIP